MSVNLEQMSKEELVAALESLSESTRERERTLEEKARLVHELQVHQIELELQNRALREAQAEIEASRNRYADLYDFAPVAYCTLDTKGCVREVNLTGATMVGRDRAHIIGLPFLALVRVQDPSLFWAHLRRCSDVGAPVVSELHLSTARHGELDVQVVSAPVLDAAGAVVAFRTAFTDITERKRAAAERDRAHASEQRLRARLEALDRAGMAVSAALAAPSPGSTRAVLQVIVDQTRALADAEYAALGVGDDPERPFEPWVYSGIIEEDAAKMGRHPRSIGTLASVICNSPVRLTDLREHPNFRGFPDHHPTMTSFLGVSICYAGERIGTLYLTNKRGAEAFDVEDERSVEMLADRVAASMEVARLRAAEARLFEEARSALRARDAMLAVVTHDLRTPLATIVLGAALLARGGGDKRAETIRRTAERMSRLVDDLLSAATIEAGRLMAEARPHSAAALVQEAVEAMAPLAAERALRLTSSAPAELPEVLCDPDRILQVLSNLLGNAAKFTPSGGEIRVDAIAAEGHVRFAVSDSGPGIREEHMEHLFEPYWRGQPMRSPGVGLGLYIAKGIVEALHGRIWVESEPGKGTTFFFTLPDATARPARSIEQVRPP